jgi:hypothetical protein
MRQDRAHPELDDLAHRSPTALAAALERALTTRDRDLERAVLAALGGLGIVVVDRTALVDTLTAARLRKQRGKGETT